MAHFISWPEVLKRVPNQGLLCFVSCGRYFCVSFVHKVYVLFLVVSSSAIDCLETGKTHLRNDQLVLNWTLNRIHSLTDIQHKHSSV